MNRIPTFPRTPRNYMSKVQKINTNREGIGENIVTILPANDRDVKIDSIFIKPSGVTSEPGVVRIFINNGKDFDNPDNNILYHEMLMPKSQANNTTIGPNIIEMFSLRVPKNYRLLASVSRAMEVPLHITVNYTSY